MTDCDRLLAALRTGPQRADALYRLGLMAHSRASDLRRRGHRITVERIPGEGTKAYLYTLAFDADAPVSLIAPEPEQLRLTA